MTSQILQQIITIYIFPNISKSKDNQPIKFDHLTECHMRNIFFSRIMQKMRQGRQFQTFFLKKKVYVG